MDDNGGVYYDVKGHGASRQVENIDENQIGIVKLHLADLCDSCNNIKSTACRGFKEDCSKCSWAYPEYYRPIKLQGSILRSLNQYAESQGKDATSLVTEWILEKISK